MENCLRGCPQPGRPCETARGGVVREGGRVNLCADGFAQLQQGQLRAHLEGLLAGGERRCDEECARGRFVAALVCLRAFGVAHVHAVLLLQALLQPGGERAAAHRSRGLGLMGQRAVFDACCIRSAIARTGAATGEFGDTQAVLLADEACRVLACRQRRATLQADAQTLVDVQSSINEDLTRADWRVNANQGYSLDGPILNVAGKVEAAPPKHMSSAVGQIVNFLGTMRNHTTFPRWA